MENVVKLQSGTKVAHLVKMGAFIKHLIHLLFHSL